MSIAGILSSTLFNLNSQTSISPQQQFKQELQQLGKDLQDGNLSAAQSDFATLQQNALSSSASVSTPNSNPIVLAFKQLGQDLQSGNLSAAQHDYSTIQQDAQSQSQSPQVRHHHHHGGGGENSSQNTIAQEFSQLSQALQSGNLSAAQQAYTTLQQSFQAFTGSNASPGATTPAPAATGGLQVTA
jgi:hypothetical protein